MDNETSLAARSFLSPHFLWVDNSTMWVMAAVQPWDRLTPVFQGSWPSQWCSCPVSTEDAICCRWLW